MCQAVWQSPLLPLMSITPGTPGVSSAAVGSGERFKRDLLAYLEAYGYKKTGSLVKQLRKYDFSAIRAALVASVPSKQRINNMDSKKTTLWGWPALKDILRQIPLEQTERASDPSRKSHIVIQVRRVILRSSLNAFIDSTWSSSLTRTARYPQLPPLARLTNG